MTSYSVFLLLSLLSILSGLLYAAVDDPMTLAPRIGRWTVLKFGLMFLFAVPFVFAAVRTSAIQIVAVAALNPALKSVAMNSGNSGVIHGSSLDFFDCVILLYGVVALFFLSRLVVTYVLTLRWLHGARKGEFFGVLVYFHDEIRTPLSFGILRPRIYFPSSAATSWTDRELRLSLAHERIHLRNWDPFWKLLSLILRSCLFFAPWSAGLHRKLEIEMEVLCDEETCRDQNATVQEYGSLLIRMSELANHPNVFATNINGSTLRRRIVAMKSRKMTRSIVKRALSALLFVGGSAAVMATAGAHPSKILYKVEGAVFVDGEKITSVQIVTQGSRKAVIEQRNDDRNEIMKMEVVAEEYHEVLPQKSPTEDPISLNFDIEVQMNSKTMHMTPKLIVTSGKEATITMSEENNHTYELRITATRRR